MDNFAKKQRATVQAAIDSGVLNNTNRSHELVDFVAKLAADKGLTFDFANNEKLKETGFAMEGVTVNGFVNNNGVTVNIQSAKALNAVVGHEITHVLEGTQLYDALAQSITEYAKAKGEYQSRYDSLAKLYAGVENANVEAEVVADLVGDYLFTDKAFVQKLSTENRNVFQKIFDEIKYLCKVVTAGSKEAKQLEKVKKAFEEAYRAETKNTVVEDGAKYSLNIKHTDGTVEELADARNLTDEQAIRYLDQAKTGKLQGHSYIPVRKDTPQVVIDTMAGAGEVIENRSLLMQVRKAQQSMTAAKSGRRAGKYGNNVRGHALSSAQIVEIVNKLDNPTMAIYQTNRSDMNGNPLPNNVAFFVEYNNNGTESVAVIEFDSSIDPEFIGTEYGDTDFHTVVTVFKPDVERDGVEFDYAEELLSNPDNIELKIEKRQSTESATRTNQSNTSNELPSNNSIRNPAGVVNTKNSLSEIVQADDIAPLPWQVRGRDVALEDFAPIGENVVTKQNAAPEGELAPVREDYAGSERRLTSSDLADYMRIGDRKHVRDGKQKILAEGDSPILTKTSEIIAFIRNALYGKVKDVIKAYGRVNHKLASAVSNATNGAVNIDDYYLELDANRIAHMQEHVEQDKDARNIPLTENQIEQIPSYLDNFDDLINVIRRKDGSIRLMLGKKINGHTIIVETVSKGRKALHPVTAYQIDTNDYIKNYKTRAIDRSSTSRSENSDTVDISRPAIAPVGISIPKQEAVVNPDDSTGAAPSPNMSYSLCFWYAIL